MCSFFWAVLVNSKECMCAVESSMFIVADAMCAVSASVWTFTADMGAVKRSVWAVASLHLGLYRLSASCTASAWDVTASTCAITASM